MENGRSKARGLLLLHLFVCLVWLYLFTVEGDKPGWMGHVFFWSVLGVQFTWGYTIGRLVGPSRAKRRQLWWSLLTIFMPLYFFSFLFQVFRHFFGLWNALAYLALFVVILACETFCGVWLGARAHGRES